MTDERKWMRIFKILSGILMTGTVIYMLTYLILDLCMPFSAISETGDAAFYIRFWSHQAVSIIQGVGLNLYFYGNVTLLIFFGKEWTALLPYRKTALFTIGTAAVALACAGLFVLLDRILVGGHGTAGNYFFPIWSVLIYAAALFALQSLGYLAGLLIRRKRPSI